MIWYNCRHQIYNDDKPYCLPVWVFNGVRDAKNRTLKATVQYHESVNEIKQTNKQTEESADFEKQHACTSAAELAIFGWYHCRQEIHNHHNKATLCLLHFLMYCEIPKRRWCRKQLAHTSNHTIFKFVKDVGSFIFQLPYASIAPCSTGSFRPHWADGVRGYESCCGWEPIR